MTPNSDPSKTVENIDLCDVHVHLQDARFGDGLEPCLERARLRGVRRFVCAGTSPADWNQTAKIAKTFSDVFPTFGVHPWFVDKISGDWATALKIVLDSTVAADGETRAAIGEIGLDFALREKNFDAQETAFRTQLEIADERRLPVVVHSVRANERVLKILPEYARVPTILLHGFVGTSAEIERAVALGAFFSFSPRSVERGAVKARQTVAALPRDRILLESDAPGALAPTAPGTRPKLELQFRDDKGAPRLGPDVVVDVAAEICAIRAVAPDEFFRQLALNERRFFQFWPRRSERRPENNPNDDKKGAKR